MYVVNLSGYLERCDSMEKLVLTGTVCFCVGLTVWLILGAVVMALAATAKKYKPKKKEIDDCWGCFGAANGDCDHCPVKDGDEDEKDTNY